MLLPWTQNVISELVWFNRTIITSDDIYSLLYLPVDSTKTKLYIRYRDCELYTQDQNHFVLRKIEWDFESGWSKQQKTPTVKDQNCKAWHLEWLLDFNRFISSRNSRSHRLKVPTVCIPELPVNNHSSI
ncbi:hypothetical protein KCU85_g482, partial [Aureobasidium melanogenum]